MVNIGFLGICDVGKTSILRTFIKCVNANDSEKSEDFSACTILLKDFSGESNIEDDKAILGKDTKTIHPNRIEFKENLSGKNHTLFAPGGDRERAIVRMGIITISRIAKEIVLVFDLEQSLSEQLRFFETIRYLPKSVYICFNKCDKIPHDKLKEKINEFTQRINRYLTNRRIKIRSYFFTSAKDDGIFSEFNNNTAKMILKIASGNFDDEIKIDNPLCAVI